MEPIAPGPSNRIRDRHLSIALHLAGRQRSEASAGRSLSIGRVKSEVWAPSSVAVLPGLLPDRHREPSLPLPWGKRTLASQPEPLHAPALKSSARVQGADRPPRHLPARRFPHKSQPLAQLFPNPVARQKQDFLRLSHAVDKINARWPYPTNIPY